MAEITMPESFRIRWDPRHSGGGYKVSIPNYDGGEVYRKEDLDELLRQQAAELEQVKRERNELRSGLFEKAGLVTANNFAEMQQRAEKAEAQLQEREQTIAALSSKSGGEPALCRTASPYEEWTCSLPEGHAGEHVARESHDPCGYVLCRWAAPPQPGSEQESSR